MEFSNFENLYYGSVPVIFRPVSGQAHDFTASNFKEHEIQPTNPHIEQLTKLSLDRCKAATWLGQEYFNLVLPAIPALDITDEKETDTSQSLTNSLLPEGLREPLLKVDENDKEQGSKQYLHGLQSGRRSALIKVDNKWYRLKGCGDLGQGFPLRRVETPPTGAPEECWELRGCMFEHTVSRELYMTNKINSILSENRLLPANEPIGWWEYALLRDGEPYPLVKRCCGVYASHGDRRLGDHVIVGLERCLPLLLSNRFELDKLLPLFEERRRKPEPPEGEGRDTVYETWICALTDNEMGNFIDIVNFELVERAPTGQDVMFVSNVNEAKGQSQSQGQSQSGSAIMVPEQFKDAWISSCTILNEELEKVKASNGIKSLLAYLFWRFGREAGTVQRLLRQNDISWGTYVDPLGTHCNSHPNNLILLPEGQSEEVFLAPLDFDMAFTRKSFNRDAATYDDWMALEDRAMKLALAGDQNLSTGVTGSAILDKNFTVLKWALRDTMVLGFISGFDNAEDAHPPIPGLSRVSHALLRLALILTAADIA
jgi:hypothetical protein